jgi:hypothetical protein
MYASVLADAQSMQTLAEAEVETQTSRSFFDNASKRISSPN